MDKFVFRFDFRVTVAEENIDEAMEKALYVFRKIIISPEGRKYIKLIKQEPDLIEREFKEIQKLDFIRRESGEIQKLDELQSEDDWNLDIAEGYL